MDIVWTWDVIRRIIEVLWLINIAFAVWTVFRSRRDIASTWAWLLVLTILPVVGFILYLFVGRHYPMMRYLVFKMSKNNYGPNILKSNES